MAILDLNFAALNRLGVGLLYFIIHQSFMKHSTSPIRIAVLLIVVFAGSSFAQIRSEGTRTEKDSATGLTRTVTYLDVKEEEVITPRHDMITINPLKFILFWNLSYYHAFNKTVAVGLGAQMPTISYFGGFGLNAEVRLYPSGKALRGFYAAPNISWNHLSYENNSGSYVYYSGSSTSAESFSLGLLLGWQWFPGDDFAIGLGIGIDHYFLSGSGNGNVFSRYNGFVPALRVDIGYGW